MANTSPATCKHLALGMEHATAAGLAMK